MVISQTDTLRLSTAGEGFLYRREAQRGVSENLYWPRGESGVTIGAGYDMRGRPEEAIAADLMRVGVERAKATLASRGAGLAYDEAKKFADDWHDLITLSEDQQRQLMENILPVSERTINNAIAASVRSRIFTHEFDALTSFTYNVGHLSGTGVAYRLNNGDVQGSFFAMLSFPTSNDRRSLEMQLYREARY